MDALLPFLPVIGAVLAIAGATPRVYRWWKWRRARVEAAERVNNRLAIKEEIGGHLPARERHLNRGVAIIRDVHRVDQYPEVTPKRRGVSPWFKVELKDLYHRGLEVFLRIEYVRLNKQKRTWESVTFSDDQTFKGYIVGRIPFDWIVRVDWKGDEFYGCPHIYCRFISNRGEPYEEIVVYYKEADARSDFLWHLQDYKLAAKTPLARLKSILPRR